MLVIKSTVGKIPELIHQIGTGKVDQLFNHAGDQVAHGVFYTNNFDGDYNKVLALCSPKYMLLQNRDILTNIHKDFGADDKIIIKELNGTMRLSLFSQEEFKSGYSAGLLIGNSMDGKDKYSIAPAILKLVCGNGMVNVLHSHRSRILHLLRNQTSLPNILDLFTADLTTFLNEYQDARLDQTIDVEKLKKYLEKMGKKRLTSFVDEEEPTTVRDVYDAITNFASNKNNYNWDMISAAANLLYNPSMIAQ